MNHRQTDHRAKSPAVPAIALVLFETPLRHVVVLRVGIVFGGIILVLLATPLVAATVLLGGKTVSDLRALKLR